MKMQSFKQRYLMLFASPYSIENPDKTKNEGVSSYWLFDDNLNARTDDEAAARGQVVHGIKPVKMTLPVSVKDKIQVCPAFYDVTLRMTTKRVEVRGQVTEYPTIQIMDVDYVGAVGVEIAAKDKHGKN
jgi:hypothetical protein